MKRTVSKWFVVFVMLAGVQMGCMQLDEFVPNCPAGAEGCLCNDDGICDDGLSCSEDLCEPVTTEDDDVAVLRNQDCAYETCDENATCDTSGETHVCVCDPGWTGNGHSCANIDECFEQTDNCDEVNGSCLDSDGSFVCECNAGWELNENGHTCDNIDDCAGDPCQNGGVCTDGIDEYFCECSAGFSGDTCVAAVRFVDASTAAVTPDGLSWTTAYSNVSHAIAALELETGANERMVWIKEGTYYIYESSLEDTVLLSSGIDLYGGFAGDETALDERDYELHPTVLDGHSEVDAQLQVYHVVTGAPGCVMDGLTITGGSANDSHDVLYGAPFGGGLYYERVVFEPIPLVVNNCTFIENYAAYSGGAAFASDVVVHYDNCTFLDNGAGLLRQVTGELGFGAGVYGRRATLVISNSYFEHNTCYLTGGAIHAAISSITVEDSEFWNNSSDEAGGAILIYSANPGESTVSRCAFYDNTSRDAGGAIYNWASTTTIENSVFANNTVSGSLDQGISVQSFKGTAVISNSTFFNSTPAVEYGFIGSHGTSGTAIVTNSILWGSTAEAVGDTVTPATVQYSNLNILGSYNDPADNNISEDPLFENAAGYDFHLTEFSPCVNTASPSAAPALDYESTQRDAQPDMGAFEY